ncbi:MAG: pectate lyase, partial [Proteiniphilum sp.]
MRGILFFRLTTALLLLTVAFSCEKNIPVIERPEQEKPIAEKPDQPGGTTGHTYPTPVTEAALAFPGARGGGIYTSGGRGGKVIRVTTLEDHGLPGSLRHAVNQPGARIVLFDVSGTIRLRSELKITQGNLTLAGQSAPGGGITLADYPVEIQADNMIVRYLRFRMGDKKVTADKDAFGARNRKNLIIDHCSMSWSTDECASFYDNENFTLQWSILSESLRLSVHEKGSHGYGGIWGGVNASFLCNLLIHHDSRTPRFCGSRYSNRPDRESVDFRNNLLYNWGANNAYGAEGGSYNLVNNYYKPGPASSNRGRLLQPYADDGKNAQPKGTHGRFYLSGNQVEGNNSVTVNNRLGVHLHSTFATHAPGVTLNDILA